MSDINLTQCVQNLKSLQKNLQKICEDHLTAQKCFMESQAQARSMWYHINKSSNDASGLLVWIDEMIDDMTPLLPESETQEESETEEASKIEDL